MNGSGGSDDDRTVLIPRQTGNFDSDRTVIQTPPGAPGADRDRPLRGQVIGTDPHSTARQGQKPAQGETIFMPQAGQATGSRPFNPVVGWVVVLEGPGRGDFRPVFYGQNSIGRDPSQRISLDFGDQRISRDTHAFIVYDEVHRRFFLRDNGKSNLVRLNGNLVIAPTELKNYDQIALGDTTLLFVALCGQTFDWLAANEHA